MKTNNTEGYIAVWLGRFESYDEFEEYIKVHYEYEDDKNINSQFEKDFDLEFYDRDIVEFSMLENKENKIEKLFEGSSYLDSFIQKLDITEILPFNVIIRIYDYKYTNENKKCSYEKNSIEFYRNIPYEKVVDLSWMGL